MKPHQQNILVNYDDGLWKNVVSKLPKENFLFGSVEHSIKDKLIDLWDTTKDDYSDYDVSKLTSILKEKEGWRKKPSYFFCEFGHPSELGHKKISEWIHTHYKDNNFI